MTSIPSAAPDTLLQRELWSSWAGVLRSYAAVYSLGREQHAVVEVSEAVILLRYGNRWLRFEPGTMYSSENGPKGFALTVNGHARIDGAEDEMDLAAERLTREIITV